MAALLEVILQKLTFILFRHHLEALRQSPVWVGGGPSIPDTHVMTGFFPLLKEVPYENVSLLFIILWFQ